jgi:guanosine-3',5'-bis(diphosphate) 3'-pyrophosphohydrolase
MNSRTKVFSALELASIRHSGQTRKGDKKTPYINHPISVINVLTRHGEDNPDLLAAAALHDVIEDTARTKEEIDKISSLIKEKFGEEVLKIILEVSDDKNLPFQKRKDLQVINTPRLSPEAKKLKIADKICNIKDMINDPPSNWSVERKKNYLEWAAKVIEGARNNNASLEKDFDETLKFAERSLNNQNTES